MQTVPVSYFDLAALRSGVALVLEVVDLYLVSDANVDENIQVREPDPFLRVP